MIDTPSDFVSGNEEEILVTMRERSDEMKGNKLKYLIMAVLVVTLCAISI